MKRVCLRASSSIISVCLFLLSPAYSHSDTTRNESLHCDFLSFGFLKSWSCPGLDSFPSLQAAITFRTPPRGGNPSKARIMWEATRHCLQLMGLTPPQASPVPFDLMAFVFFSAFARRSLP